MTRAKLLFLCLIAIFMFGLAGSASALHEPDVSAAMAPLAISSFDRGAGGIEGPVQTGTQKVWIPHGSSGSGRLIPVWLYYEIIDILIGRGLPTTAGNVDHVLHELGLGGPD